MPYICRLLAAELSAEQRPLLLGAAGRCPFCSFCLSDVPTPGEVVLRGLPQHSACWRLPSPLAVHSCSHRGIHVLIHVHGVRGNVQVVKLDAVLVDGTLLLRSTDGATSGATEAATFPDAHDGNSGDAWCAKLHAASRTYLGSEVYGELVTNRKCTWLARVVEQKYTPPAPRLSHSRARIPPHVPIPPSTAHSHSSCWVQCTLLTERRRCCAVCAADTPRYGRTPRKVACPCAPRQCASTSCVKGGPRRACMSSSSTHRATTSHLDRGSR
jgi:hypothetical protein